jgi:hypothetical protein
MDWTTPRRVQAASKVSALYSEPLSLWKITPRVVRPWPVRVVTAIRSAASVSPASWASAMA